MAGYGDYTIGHPRLDPTSVKLKKRQRTQDDWGRSTPKRATVESSAGQEPKSNRHPRVASVHRLGRSFRAR